MPGPQQKNDTGRPDKPLILIVERDLHTRELQEHFLTEAGFAVEFAEDGRAALEQVRTLKPKMIITEILLPKLDGLALCRQIKEAPETRMIPVLVFSILAASLRAKDAGADAFLLKPLAEHRLISTVHSLLGKSISDISKEQA